MPSFCLYFPVDWCVAASIQRRTRDALKDGPRVSLATGAPHITLFYGPEIEGEELKSYSREDIGKIYPGIEDLRDLKMHYRGVSHFLRADAAHIKLEYECWEADLFRDALRQRYPKVLDAELRAHEADGDNSRGPKPTRWLHLTICSIPAPYRPEDVLRVEDAVREALAGWSLDLGTPDSLTFVSAVTDTEYEVSLTPEKGVYRRV